MDARSVVSNEDDDKRSVASTTATTASLASRIQSLAVDFGPKVEGITEGFPEGEDEGGEEVIEITEDQLLQELDRQEPAFQRLEQTPENECRKLSTTRVRRQLRSQNQTQYVVVDNFLTFEHAARIRAETLAYVRQGRLQESSNTAHNHPGRSSDRAARSDRILWLQSGRAAALSPSFAALLHAFKELQDDLAQIMHLRRYSTEHQLSYYAANGSQYVRHRDAFPDDRIDGGERKVTAIVYANTNWRREDGGKLRLWPPRTSGGAPDGSAAASESSHGEQHPFANGHADLSRGSRGAHDLLSTRPQPGSPKATLQRASAGTSATGAEESGLSASSANSPARQGQLAGAGMPSESPLPGGARSPKSISSSIVAEATDASSIPDNVSADGSSVKSAGRGEMVGNAAVVAAATGEVGSAAVVDVAPIAGRLVFLLSGSVEHAVLPTFAERIAITCWCQ